MENTQTFLTPTRPPFAGPDGSATEAALRMAKEWAVNAALTGKPWLSRYYLRKAVALECVVMDERKSPNKGLDKPTSPE